MKLVGAFGGVVLLGAVQRSIGEGQMKCDANADCEKLKKTASTNKENKKNMFTTREPRV